MARNALPHFFVLPDCDIKVIPAIERTTKVVEHDSGRPWIVFGARRSERLMMVRSDSLCVAVVGHFDLTERDLQAAVSGVDRLTELDSLGMRVPGSFHIIASDGHRVRFQGSASGMRRVYHAKAFGSLLAADRADVLAALVDASIDASVVATRLVHPVPYPITELSCWSQVEAVPPGDALVLDGDARLARHHRWWQPPEAETSLAHSAKELRIALHAAIRARTETEKVISCDLSGGLDSTPLCYLASQMRPRAVGITAETLDPAADDTGWACRAADQMPKLEHKLIAAEEVPRFYAGLLDIGHISDDPTYTILSTPRYQTVVNMVRREGSRSHITGLGGDLVLQGAPAYCYDAVRGGSLRKLRLLRSYQIIQGWPRLATVRSMLHKESYSTWLSGQPTAGGTRQRVSALEWGIDLQAPPWVTPTAVDRLREVFRTAAQNAEPFAPSRGRHWDVFGIREQSRLARAVDHVGGVGVCISSPYLDDQVMQVCLTVRPEERTSPWEFKPLIKEAMKDVMPNHLLTRTTKSVGSMEAAIGLAQNKNDLLKLWDDSRLAQLDLVDTAQLRHLIMNPSLPEVQHHDAAILDTALMCELWLRNLTELQRDHLAMEVR